MALTSGAHLGPYEIASLVGVGGMGEVYRATDTNLKRAVAIKVLPDALAADPERLARFQREAEVLASLNHPNIAAIYGLERANSTTALVMELVEGPTLADRIAPGRLPVDEALAIARQIAEGLEAAHDRGIVHRDLKPANIKLRPDGAVKILDFGLAKALGADTAGASSAAMTNSPTITSPIGMTGVGIILGTAAYMAPEQAKGFAADHRSDIFSFGCVLYEMMTGRQAFDGDTVSDVLASIIAREPDFTRLPPNLHPRLVELLQRCLAKNPRRRWHAAGDLRIELESAAATPFDSPSPMVRRRTGSSLQLASLVAAAALAAGLTWWFKPVPRVGVTGVTKFTVPLALGGQVRGVVASISHDGSRIAFVSNNRLWQRPLSSLTSTELQGTAHPTGVGSPVFSPDGRSIAFWVGGRNGGIQVVPVAGGAATTVCPAGPVVGMVWTGDALYFGQVNLAGNVNPQITRPGIYRVAAKAGAEAELVVGADRDEVLAHPFPLPDGDTLLMTSASATRFDRWAQSRIVAYSMKAATRHVVVNGGADARYLPTGHIVYALGGILYAAAFDVTRRETTGSSVAVVEGVNRATAFSDGNSQFWVSDNGTLIYQPGLATTRTLTNGIVVGDRQGRMQALKLPESPYESPRVSPDGAQIAYVIDDGQEAHIWVAPLSLATQPIRLTSEGRNRFPVWSPDGTRIAFQSNRDGGLAIYLQRAEPGRAEPLTKPDVNVQYVPESWSRERNLLSYSAVTEQGASLWVMSVDDRKTTQIPNTTSQSPLNSSFSRDGQWLAYGTRPLLGGANIYVESFPPRDRPYQLTDGIPAHHPMWSPDGSEIFFFSGTSSLQAIALTTRPTFKWLAPVAAAGAFPPVTTGVSGPNYDITPDSKRFVFIGYPNSEGGVDARNEQRLDVVLNWFDVLKAAGAN